MAANTEHEPLSVQREAPVLMIYILTSLMMVCVAATLAGLIHILAPAWNETYLMVVSFLVTFETLYAMRATRRVTFPSRAWLRYRGAELVAVIVLLKLLFYTIHGFDLLGRDIQLWQQNFFGTFFSGEYLVAVIVVLVVWALAHQMNGDLLEMEADDATLERERRYEFRVDRQTIRKQLMLKVVLIGAGLVIVTVMMRVYLRSQGGETAAASVNVWNLLAYVFLSLLLLSQARFTALRAAWYRERASVGEEVARRWVIYSVLFLLLVAAVVIVLPTRYSLGLLGTLAYLVGWLAAIFQVIVYVLLLILTFPITLLMRLLGGSGSQAPTPTPPAPPPTPLAPAPAGSDPLWELIKSVLFWAFFLIMTGWALKSYLGRHREWLAVLRSIPVLHWLVQGMTWLWRVVCQGSRQVAGAVEAGLRALRPRQAVSTLIAERTRLLHVRRLPPRERVQYFYLAMVRRGAQRGAPRRASQTPREYASTLESTVPEVNSEIEALTDSFAEARYSLHDVSAERAGSALTLWQRIRAALRRF